MFFVWWCHKPYIMMSSTFSKPNMERRWAAMLTPRIWFQGCSNLLVGLRIFRISRFLAMNIYMRLHKKPTSVANKKTAKFSCFLVCISRIIHSASYFLSTEICSYPYYPFTFPPSSPSHSLLPPSSYPVSLYQSNPCTMIRITPHKVVGEGGRKEQSAPLHGNQGLER